MASALWSRGSAAEWSDVRARRASILESNAKQGLPELEAWLVDELPAALAARTPRHLTKEEAVKLVEWKLKRGKFRPNLLRFAQELQPEAVAAATAAGFAHLPAPGGAPGAAARAAMAELTSLKGVGPATATAMMAAADPSIPYFGDEAWAAACGGKAKYSEAEAMQLRGKLGPKAGELRKETGDETWTAAEVERCLFLAELEAKGPPSSSQGSGKKRGAPAASSGGGGKKKK
ncbi:hypothetical protein Rsub_04684 [Raphidocelis subcapitata]|uniref:Uncharacterized protein n=1 Tax=Raphidocelis subcapitata TaxID=307507 RepID=A0A2V0P290_9CHLO|nr:hypothetical protein Rsub_04684 [Raphidocelis subcapitata]|eukprot:GBF91960.1 hypothetical protein Rsub_04684 [Raphidocelis subcapitata]